ncbi:MAG TPA: ATP-binding protein [Candidatus Hydrogenedentes bacterium]|jgi:signal transduction histidine kinase|nr:MAG: Non-motile and phage-resistance protein [Candidatus Hydrogenedentes bacterium ADurb.Bin170]HNZ48649.1 ATP-binding protein [Candidatus Hydrogenedentota bacterium]HOD94753.1 ATP-binding protein [Candidatus Hydrogenedentota bacterium]HOH43071.1 ATP-binding protein [Candidatus Hydrogenedentota bacterium]HOM47266.1 ATP-binding protein [Candidatus Hydrogenedentota bacterium]
MDTIKVLVVDDEIGIRVSIARILKKMTIVLSEEETEAHFEVEQAETGEQALQLIRESPPEILLLDNKLPGISGFQVLEQIAAMNLGIQTVMITAYASIENAIHAARQGAYDMLPKPFTPVELKRVLEKVANHVIMARRARELAAEKKRVRFQFISVLAHELQVPINAIENYLRVMRDRTLGEDMKSYDAYLDRCLLRSEYMRKMISDLLDLTRIESGERARTLEPCNLVEAARLAMDALAGEAAQRGIELVLDTRRVSILADHTEIDIILNNLISNAIKYNRDQGKVEIAFYKKGDEVKIQVADTGIGMSAEDCSRIFNDFARIKNTRTSRILGSGLGLSTVKKIALLYNGSVSVSSVPDEGTTFTVILKDAGAADSTNR